MADSIDASSSANRASNAQQSIDLPTESTFTEPGQNLEDIANERGIPLDDLIKNNEQIFNPWLVPAGSFVNIPSQAENDANNNSSQTPASAVAGAPAAREATIGAFQQRAYDAGANAPQSNFNGDIFRSGGTRHIDGTFDATRGGMGVAPGRYNAPGQAMIYTSPSAAENVGEMTAYKPNMAGNSMLESNLNLTVDENGRGGMADIRTGLQQQRISESALTVPKGAQEMPPLYKALGEHPTQKPVALTTRCLLASTCEGDFVFDPFLGSGTTAIACLRNLRRFVGIDTRPAYVSLAVDRSRAEMEKGAGLFALANFPLAGSV